MLLKSFRLFISSTFADFKAEREILQSQVFPALDAYCSARGYQFYPLDMRWGINEEAGLDQRTADICLEEVEAANGYPPPNFLILIGDRYGWVPLPFAIARDEFEAMVAWLNTRGDQEAVNVIRHVYRLDENRLMQRGLAESGEDSRTLTSAYTLLSREDEIPELRSQAAWGVVEVKVRAALQLAADALLKDGQIGMAARDKYFLSLTERELRGNLDRAMAGEHGAEAIAFVRALDGPCDAFRERQPQTVAAVAALRERVERMLAQNQIARGTAQCVAIGKLDAAYLTSFAAKIEGKLKEAVDRHIAKVEAMERGPSFGLQVEREEHRAFRVEKLKVFVGRENNLAAIAQYLAGEASRPLVLHGCSGSGKSALMARAIEMAENAGHATIVYRFIGASAGSSDLRALLMSVIDDLADKRLVERPAEYVQDANKFATQIKALLASISRSAVIFLDALDQLKKPYRIDWLPETLPDGVRLVLSVLDDPVYEPDSEAYRLLRMRRLPEHAFLDIEPLTPTHGRDIIVALETQANRELRDSQRDVILRRFKVAGASPLYLRTAFEIAKGWRGWNVDPRRHVLATDTSGLIAQFIADLVSEHHHETELVTRTLGFLAAAKDGLSAKEMTEVLSNDEAVMRAISAEDHGHHTKKLPPAVWARLYRALSPFLIEKRIDDQPLLHFFHRQVADRARYDHYEPSRPALHAALATYFEDRATPLDGRKVYDMRSLSELPYQLYNVGDARHAARLNEVLLSPDWMEQKLHVFASPVPLIEDYRSYAPYVPERKTAASLVGRALEQSAGALARDERQLLPHLLGRLRAGMAPGLRDVIANVRRALRPPVLLPKLPTLTPIDSALLWTYEGHVDGVWVVAFSPDGGRIVSGSADRTLRLWDAASGAAIGSPLQGHENVVSAAAYSPDGKRIVSASTDSTLRLWDAASGAAIGSPLQGHRAGISKAVFSPDGKRIVSGSEDSTLRLWDAASGTQIGSPLQGHDGPVWAVAFSPDGKRIVSGSEDSTLRLWDAASGAAIGPPLEGHGGQVFAVAFSPDSKRIVSSSHDGTLRLWDAASGAAIGSPLQGHDGPVWAVAFSPDGKRIVSGTWNSKLRLWDAVSGMAIGTPIRGHGGMVTALAFSPDGKRIVSGSWDRTVRLWDAASDSAIGSPLQGHGDGVTAVAFSHDGELIFSGSDDGTLQLWNSASGDTVGSLFQGHGGSVRAVAFSPDGKHIVSSSDDETLRLWDAASGAPIGPPIRGHRGWVWGVAFSPDGKSIVSGSWDRTIRLWDVKSRVAIGSPLVDIGHLAMAVAFSPDGKCIVSGSADKMLRLWDAASGVAIGSPIQGHKGAVRAVAFAPDGKSIASGSDDRTIRLWDAASGAAIGLPILGHENVVSAVAFLNEGKSIVSGSWDNSLRVWDAASGAQIARFEGDTGFTTIAVKEDMLAAGDAFNRPHILLWIVDAAAKAAELARFDNNGSGAVTAPVGGATKAAAQMPNKKAWWRWIFS